jgi:hypothetical protein
MKLLHTSIKCNKASSEITSFGVSQSKTKGIMADECPEIISASYFSPTCLYMNKTMT